jgi:hypothetical protein
MPVNGRFAPKAASRKSNNGESAFHSEADIARQISHVRKVPILLQKSFRGAERKLEPLMRFACGDVRDHIVSSKIDRGPRNGVEKRRSGREVQRSTFARFSGSPDFRLLQPKAEVITRHQATRC